MASIVGREVRIHKTGSDFDNWTGFVTKHEKGQVSVAIRSVYSFGDCFIETLPENDIDVVADYVPGAPYEEIPYAEWKPRTVIKLSGNMVEVPMNEEG